MSDLERTPLYGAFHCLRKKEVKKTLTGAVRHKLLPLKDWIFLSINGETLRESSMNWPYLNRYIEQLLCPLVHKVSFNIN